MIPKTPGKTTNNAHEHIDGKLKQINGFRKTLYVGLAAMAVAIGAQKCTDTIQQQGIEDRVGRYEATVTSYENRIEQNRAATQRQAGAIKNIQENGFYIGTPCYDPETEYRINVTPCTTKTE